MNGMATDYQNVVAGGRGGMNYFIAFPSLHVAASAICLWGLRGSGVLFWAMWPTPCWSRQAHSSWAITTHPGGTGHGCVVLAPVRTRCTVTSALVLLE